MNNLLEQIQDIPILEIAAKLNIGPIKHGATMCFMGHDIKSPSLKFSTKKNVWYCFSCAIGGGNIKLVMKALKIDFKPSLEWICQSFHLYRSSKFPAINSKIIKNIRKIIQPKELIEEEFYKPNPDIYEFLLSKLSLSQTGLQYLLNRGYTRQTIDILQIKDTQDPNSLKQILRSQFKTEELEISGLLRHDPNKNFYKFPWWKHALIFPFFDEDGRLSYFQGRNLAPNLEQKYLNIFGIRKPIYNLHILPTLSKGDSIYFFEGITDAIMGIQNKINAFGILGASGFREQWANKFTSFQIKVVPDNDKAGETFSRTITLAFSKLSKEVQINKVPYGKDYSEYILSLSKQ